RVAPGQNPQAFLTILYGSTNRRWRAGATVENLAHSASFHCWPNNAPSNPGTKHLSQRERWIGKSLCTHAHLGKRCGRMKKARAGCSHPRFLSIQPLERSGRRQSCLGLLDDGTECGAFVHRQVGHDLPIEFDPGELSAVDE